MKRHFARIALFIEATPHPRGSTEHVFRGYIYIVSFPTTFLALAETIKDELGMATAKVS